MSAKSAPLTPPNVQEIKFCINCANFIPEVKARPVFDADHPAAEGSPPRCGLAQMLDIVSGQKFYALCGDFRHPEAPCGQDAKFFTPKPDAEPIKAPDVAQN